MSSRGRHQNNGFRSYVEVDIDCDCDADTEAFSVDLSALCHFRETPERREQPLSRSGLGVWKVSTVEHQCAGAILGLRQDIKKRTDTLGAKKGAASIRSRLDGIIQAAGVEHGLERSCLFEPPGNVNENHLLVVEKIGIASHAEYLSYSDAVRRKHS